MRHMLTSVGYVLWVAAIIQLRVIRIQMYIHVMVLNHIDAVLCIGSEFQILEVHCSLVNKVLSVGQRN